LTVLLCHLPGFGQINAGVVTINGQFVGNFPERLPYTVPVNGVAFRGFFETVTLDSLGRFEIRLEVEKPVLINFLYWDSPSLIIEPNKNYDIILSLSPERLLRIEGSLDETQEFYNSLVHTHPMRCIFAIGSHDVSEYTEKSQELQAELQRELDGFENFFNNGEISEEVFSLLVADRKVFFGTAQAVMASMNFNRIIGEGGLVTDELMGIWRDAVSWGALNQPFLLSSFYAYDYLLMTLWYHLYANLGYDEVVAIRAEKREQGVIHSHTIEIASKCFLDKTLEFFIASYIHEQYIMRIFDRDLITVYEQFKTLYPLSGYLRFLEPLIKRVEEIVGKQ